MRTCANCGSEIGSGDVFCGICGTGQAPLAAPGGREYGPRGGGAGYPAPAPAPAAAYAATAAGPAPGAARENPAPAPSSVVPPSGPIAPGAGPDRADETIEQKYLRHTRNATVFIAVIVGIFTTITVIGTIWTVVHISQLNSQLNGNSIYGNSTCQSQGGTNPAC